MSETVFTKVDYDLSTLVKFIAIGMLALTLGSSVILVVPGLTLKLVVTGIGVAVAVGIALIPSRD